MQQQSDGQIIIGIDPGTIKMGYAIIRHRKNMPELMDYGVLNLQYVDDAHEKLHQIFVKMEQLIQKYQISELAIEAPFFGKNVQSMLKLGRAQGVVISAARYFGLISTEYSPRKIKQSVAGNGNASKEQVARMIEKQFGVSLQDAGLDATDALSVAICHSFSKRNIIAKGGSKNWSDFIRKNPDKVL
ncbi:MAG: crossover junction endodeoxyribonuclease RuvC [Saprospiraceae bacterium]|nr:crossover junction endodeoxyribonuclease RuvC [Saprospiraceae bacterium]